MNVDVQNKKKFPHELISFISKLLTKKMIFNPKIPNHVLWTDPLITHGGIVMMRMMTYLNARIPERLDKCFANDFWIDMYFDSSILLLTFLDQKYVIQVKWKPRVPGRFKLNTDGAAKESPGTRRSWRCYQKP